MMWMIWMVVLLAGTVSSQSDTCPTFGTDETSISRSREERIFLNFEAPSQCRGSVTSWNYCHYESRDGNKEQYGAKLLVYRRSSATSDDYVQVAGSVTELILLNNDVREFDCGTIALTQPFEIQENDIIAACVWNEGAINPLYLVGNGASTDQYLYQYDRGMREKCKANHLQSVDTGHNDFTLRRNFRLHLHADIAVAGSCRVGNNPAAMSPLSTSLLSGTYLNTDHPVNCATENTITSWHYCYFTSGVTPGQTYTMTVGVWSLDTNTNVYRLTEGSARTITLVPVATLAKVFCVEETLEASNSVSVAQNDVIGVVLPNNNAIPVLTSNAALSLIRHSQAVTTPSLVASEFSTTSNRGLHLYSNLEYIPVPTEATTSTTEPVPTTSATTATVPDPTSETVASTSSMTPATSEPLATETTTTQQPQRQTTHSSTASSTTLGGQTDHESGVNTEMTTSSTSSAEGTLDVGGQGLSTGDVTAVLLSVVILVVVVAVVVLFVYVCKQRRKPLAERSIQNVTYELEEKKHDIDSQYSEIEMSNSYAAVSSDYLASNLSEYSIPVPSKLEDIYEEIPGNELENSNVYYTPMDTAQGYNKKLEEAKKGDLHSESSENPYHFPANEESALFLELRKLNIKTIHGSTIKIQEKLGAGQFGNVHQGTWTQSPRNIMQVAIKTLKHGSSSEDKIKFLQEAAIMAQFRHPNVITLHGVAEKDGQRMIVVELLQNGDLQKYLKKLKPEKPNEALQSSLSALLLEFSQQICLGMGYLSLKGFVHRDLAARNILVSADNVCKIADFGMSRDLQETDYYVASGGKIPLKWTAPEALHYKKYSTASDVWSYGCVLYEIWSLGTKPFDKYSNAEVLRKLHAGFRLPPPPGCPKRVYEVMIQTWSGVAGDRPSFRNMLLCLLENKTVVLTIPSRDKSSHPQAGVLGAPIEAGERMYTELQNIYKV